ncbi:MAG: hypothetical protein WC492_02455 [Candidatus Micrarchaeia archaeon]
MLIQCSAIRAKDKRELLLDWSEEAKELGWGDKDKVVITAFRDKDGEGIEIGRAPVKRK